MIGIKNNWYDKNCRYCSDILMLSLGFQWPRDIIYFME